MVWWISLEEFLGCDCPVRSSVRSLSWVPIVVSVSKLRDPQFPAQWTARTPALPDDVYHNRRVDHRLGASRLVALIPLRRINSLLSP